jgi:hypothetical protein
MSYYYNIRRLFKKEEIFDLRNGKIIGILNNKQIITEDIGNGKINDDIIVRTNGIKIQYIIEDIIPKRDGLGLGGYWEVYIVEKSVYKNKERKNKISWSVSLLLGAIGEFASKFIPK